MKSTLYCVLCMILLNSCGNVETTFIIDPDGGIASDMQLDMSSVLMMMGGEDPLELLEPGNPRRLLFTDTTMSLFQFFQADNELNEILTSEQIQLLKEQEVQVDYSPETSQLQMNIRSEHLDQREFLKSILTVMSLGEKSSDELTLPYSILYKSGEENIFFELNEHHFSMPASTSISMSTLMMYTQAQTPEEQLHLSLMNGTHTMTTSYKLPYPIGSIEGEGWTFKDDLIQFTTNLASCLEDSQVSPVKAYFKE